MAAASESKTSPTLLGRLRQHPTDQEAWSQFVLRYEKRIHAWCLQWKLQESDAQDVTQIVLSSLVAKIPVFVYDPARSFRAWLRTLARHAWCDFVQCRTRAVQGTGDGETADVLLSVEAREDFLLRLEESFDLELLHEALERVKLTVKAHTFQAFVQTALDGRSTGDVAAELGMTIAEVHVARSRVRKKLQEILRSLDEPEGRFHRS